MHDTEQVSTGPVALSESDVMPSPGQPQGIDAEASIPPDAIVRMMGLINEVEHLFGDPARAWAALKTEIEYRKALRESRRPGGASGPADGEPGHVEQGSGGPVPSPPEPNRSARRPFVGFDREQATYDRLKHALLETAEGKWVVIVGEDVIGPVIDIEEALRRL